VNVGSINMPLADSLTSLPKFNSLSLAAFAFEDDDPLVASSNSC